MVIRAYIPPYRKETVEEPEKEEEYTDFPEADDEMTVPLKTGVAVSYTHLTLPTIA